MFRWRFNAQNRVKMQRRSGELKVAEIQDALYRLIKLAQAKVYPKEMDAMQKNNTLIKKTEESEYEDTIPDDLLSLNPNPPTSEIE